MVGDIPVKEGTAVNYIVRPTFYDENIFDEPLKFKPERWAEESQEKRNLLSVLFATGPRTCIGKNFALMDTKIVFIKFLQRY